jgi:hypothetical protein
MADRWYLDRIDCNTPGPRDDVSPLFADGAALAAAVEDLATLCDPLGYDVVAGIDALGFALGAALAGRAGCGLILVRKAGKLPVPLSLRSLRQGVRRRQFGPLPSPRSRFRRWLSVA